jgi:nucleotide-binding universal stress UspA family protein
MSAPILVGIDDSPRAADALSLAASLAAPLSAALVVASVYPQIGQPWLPGADDRRATLRSEAQAVLDGARDLLGDPDAAVYRSAGGATVPAALVELAEETGAGLIVVAQTHRGPVRRMAGVAEHLLHGAAVPVAVAPPGLAEQGRHGIDRVAVAFDGSPESEAAIGEAAAIAARANASLRIVGVFDTMTIAWVGPARENVDRDFADALMGDLRAAMEAAAERRAPGAGAVLDVIEGPPGETLIAVSRGADLLVCGSHGVGPVGAALIGSVANRLVHSAACPVLVVPKGAAAA